MEKKKLALHFLDHLFVRFPFQPYRQPHSWKEAVDFFQSDFQQTALMLGSDVLYKKLNSVESWSDSDDKKAQKLKLSFTKYFLRAHTRPTPFGLFAGMDTVKWAENTNLLFDVSQSSIQTHSCLDIDLIYQFLNAFKKNDVFIQCLKFKPNPTLYKVGTQFRYTETTVNKKGKRYELNAFDYDDFYLRLFEFCNGGKTIHEIADFLAKSEEVEFEEAYGFTQELIASDVLNDSFGIAVSGNPMLEQFQEYIRFIHQSLGSKLTKEVELKSLIETAEESIKKLLNFDQNGQERMQLLLSIQEELALKFPNFNPSHVIQVNAHPHLKENTLSDELQQKIKKTLYLLSHLATPPIQKGLEKFKDDFTSKYGEQRISILVALDPENGIAYGNLSPEMMDKNPFLSDLSFRAFGGGSGMQLSNSDFFLLEKMNEAIESGSSTIALTEKDFPKQTWDKKRLLPTITISFSIYEENDTPLIHLQDIGQSSAVNMLARFHEQDPSIEKALQEVNDIEKAYYKNQVVAELAHLPEARMGNVVHRPLFRDYDIPYLGNSAQQDDKLLHVNDLYICIEEDEIRIYSKRLDKYIIPRLSNAHNYDLRTPQIYQFLCHLQFQRKLDGIYFSWGNLLHLFDHFPRVTIEGVVVSKEKWILHDRHIKIIKTSEDVAAYFRANKLPSRFLVLEGDNYLPIDLNIPWSVELFIAEIGSKKRLEIEEHFDYNSSVLKDENGNGIVHEFNGIIYQKTSTTIQAEHYGETSEIQRKFPIGSEWLYLKIFTGVKTAELILTEIIAPFLRETKDKKWIKQWFFIKYDDGGNHLRVRFLMTSPTVMHEILACLNALLSEKELASRCRIELAEFEREIERYHPLLIDEVEKIFNIGSNLSLALLEQDAVSEIARWKWAAVICNELMNAFELEPKDKQALCDQLGQAFVKEHGFSTNQRKLLDKKFRKIEPELTLLVTERNTETDFVQAHFSQSNAFKKIISAYAQLDVRVDQWELIGSLMHMELNRLFRSNQRKNEMVIYYCLAKMYRSLIARSKKEGT